MQREISAAILFAFVAIIGEGSAAPSQIYFEKRF
jgi:hypothetical protein